MNSKRTGTGIDSFRRRLPKQFAIIIGMPDTEQEVESVQNGIEV